MPKYFISDLHINNSGNSSELFIDFLNRLVQTENSELYILGDLFEVWLGDDLEIPKYQAVITALKNTSKKIPISFLVGNRDFLIGQSFLQASGMSELNDPHIFTNDNQRICLTHGDAFCTLDRKYQIFRKIVRNKLVKFLFLSLPKALRNKIGMTIRRKSAKFKEQSYQQKLDLKQFDINPTSLKAFIKDNHLDLVIHGHTHIPLVENYIDLASTRYVLGEWHKDKATILKLEKSQKISHLEQTSV